MLWLYWSVKMPPTSLNSDVLLWAPKQKTTWFPTSALQGYIEPSLISANLMSLTSVFLYKLLRKNRELGKDSLCFSITLPFSKCLWLKASWTPPLSRLSSFLHQLDQTDLERVFWGSLQFPKYFRRPSVLQLLAVAPSVPPEPHSSSGSLLSRGFSFWAS